MVCICLVGKRVGNMEMKRGDLYAKNRHWERKLFAANLLVHACIFWLVDHEMIFLNMPREGSEK